MEQYDTLINKGLTIDNGVIVSMEDVRNERKRRSIFDHDNIDLYYDIFDTDHNKQELAFAKPKQHKETNNLTKVQRNLISEVLDIHEKSKIRINKNKY